MTGINDDNRFNRNILVAVDDSDFADRAARYVGFILGGDAAAQVLLLHVIPPAEDDFFPSEKEKAHWVHAHTKQMARRLENLRRSLIGIGFSAPSVITRLTPCAESSIAAAILSEARRGGYGTIVVGRHGLSRQEQFLFGSVSNALVNQARRCAVWVVE